MAWTDSRPMQLLSCVWLGRNVALGHSWERVNVSMRDALCLAISSGMRFEREDWENMAKWRPRFWRRTEDMYSRAVFIGNRSAAITMERSLGRKPFIVDNANGRARDRVAVGSRLLWHFWKGDKCVGNEWLRVTSICGDTLIAVKTKHVQTKPPCNFCGCGSRRKARIVRRVRITHADIRAERKARKAREVALAAEQEERAAEETARG